MTDSIRHESPGIKEHEHEDRLGRLPDDILLNILDKLELLRDAVRTCVLSKRWRHLVGLRADIVLDVTHYQPEVIPPNYTFEELVQANTSLVEAAKSVLAHKSHHTITNLSIRFYLRDESLDILRSTEDAMSIRRVVTAEFKIVSEKLDKYSTHDDKIIYGRRFVKFLHSYPRAFAGLTDLCLHNLRLGESDIPNLLATCKKLEYLGLQYCDAGVRSVLQIEHSQLAVLAFAACAFERIELIRFPRLRRLTCKTWVLSQDTYPLSFGYVPQLSALILSNTKSTLHRLLNLSELLRNAAIATLDLNFQCRTIWIQPEGAKQLGPLLQNLEKVRLRLVHDYDLTWTMFLLEAAPLLKEISIQVWDHKCDINDGGIYEPLFQTTADHLSWKACNGFKHYSLSKLTIEGFQAEEKLTRYIRQILEVAENLELLALLKSRICGPCGFRPSPAYPVTEEEREHIRKQILEWRLSPITVKFSS